ncbi:hypothetical protein [Nocardioides panacisoli]|uniref:DUF4129 domain-containing protein n=1 Tax=Nocardioides panacisoli TaxID=627624 RepID=A0ABP7HVY0_9ACTN
MLATADGDLPEEFHGPVGYSDLWLWLAVAGVALVALYYLAAWLLTRPRPTGPGRWSRTTDVPSARREHLERIDAIEADVRAGRIPARVGHQRLSEVVRSYVEAVSALPARTMALADFRAHAPAPLADAIELMYPPEFAPEPAVAQERFDLAVRDGRRLVTSWS